MSYKADPNDNTKSVPSNLPDSFFKTEFVNLQPKGEPNLGKRGLYPTVGGQQDGFEAELAIISILNLSDGNHSLLDIAERTGIDFSLIKRTTDRLIETKLIEEISLK